MTREDTVRWYFVPEDRDRFPYYTRFFTGNYMDSRVTDWPGVGEIKGTKKYRKNPDVWNFPGKKNCIRGTEDQFATGMSVKDPVPPVPKCCEPRPTLLADGGCKIWGNLPDDPTVVVYDPHVETDGGCLVQGITRLAVRIVYSAAGGVIASGTAYLARRMAYSAAGGVVGGGTAYSAQTIAYVPVGGVVEGGQANLLIRRNLEATAGCSIGGQTLYTLARGITTLGGYRIGGLAPLSLALPLDATGGVSVGGVAFPYLSVSPPATGGAKIGGTADVTVPSSGIDTCGCTGVPTTLFATIADTGGCSCLDGVTVTLTYDGTQWTGSTTACSSTLSITFVCTTSPNWELTAVCTGGFFPSNAIQSPITCSPFDWSSPVTFASFSNCCSGTTTITVTA